MSAPSDLKTLDFSNPRRLSSDAIRHLSAWHASTCAMVQDSWGTLLAHPLTLSAGGVEPMQLRAALSRVPEDGLALYYAIGPELTPSMLVFSPRQVQGLISDLLNLSGDDWPEPRPLTGIETAMLEVLFQKLAEGMGDAWPGSDPLPCRFLETAVRPQRSRLFPPESALLVSKLQLKSRFGEDACYWLLLKEETEQLIFSQLGESLPEERSVNASLAELAERVPVQVRVELGRAELSMSQVEHLGIGDVLLLDQFVNRPLVATVEGHAKWAGSPLRIGSRQAFQITHLIESETNLGMLLGQSPPAAS